MFARVKVVSSKTETVAYLKTFLPVLQEIKVQGNSVTEYYIAEIAQAGLEVQDSNPKYIG